MNTILVRVLLVGESAKGCSHLLRRLERLGCECCVAASSSEAARLSVEQVFDLVLCTDLEKGINTLITFLTASPTSLFRCYPVEDNCWWLPVLRHGEKCLGALALRPSEFAHALDGIVEEIKSGKHLPGEISDSADNWVQGQTDVAPPTDSRKI